MTPRHWRLLGWRMQWSYREHKDNSWSDVRVCLLMCHKVKKRSHQVLSIDSMHCTNKFSRSFKSHGRKAVGAEVSCLAKLITSVLRIWQKILQYVTYSNLIYQLLPVLKPNLSTSKLGRRFSILHFPIYMYCRKLRAVRRC